MKPKRIIILRHAQSEANVDKSIYGAKPDFSMNLTELGKRQALEAGEKIKGIIGLESLFCYVSPFYRTRQTFELFKTKFIENRLTSREDIRIREVEYCTALRMDDEDGGDKQRTDAEKISKFYYRFNQGESCSDSYVRISSFLDTLHRDFEKPSYPDNVVIFSHGLSARVFLMRWFHWTVEDFEVLRNPANCEYYILKKNNKDKYDLITPLKKHEKLQRIY